MRTILLILSMSIVSWSSSAHAPNEAFFEFFESNNQLLIKAELPWTIRQILLTAKPELKAAKTKQQMQAGLLAYLQENLEVRNEKNEAITIKSIKAAPNTNGHGHGVVYMLMLGKNQYISSIKNTCMFDGYTDQTNFHRIEREDRSVLEFMTNKANTTYKIQLSTTEIQGSSASSLTVASLGGLLFLLVFLFLKHDFLNI